MSASMMVSDWERFLESNYHQLSRRIRVENLLSRLRSTSVLSLDDQEMILNTYRTPFLKAGHLLDIVRMKGKTGFTKFMEAIEYEYPEVFREVTGREPRPNPDNVYANRTKATMSIVVLDQMGELIHTFTDELTKKQSELKQFKELVQELRTDLVRQTEEQKNLEDQIRHFEEIVQELREEKKEMTESLTKERRTREELEAKYNSLRSTNLDEMYNRSRQQIRQCVSLNPNQKEPKSSLAGKVKLLREAYEQGNTKPEEPVETDTKSGSEVCRTSADVTAVLQENCCRLQESNDRLQCCIEEFKKEADECRSKQLEAESVSRGANAENEKLKAEMRKMEDQCKVMADMIRSLKNEIDSRPPRPKNLPIPRMFPKSDSTGEDDESSSDASSVASPDKAGWFLTKSKRGSSESSATVTNTLLQSSFGLFVDPWKSVDSS